MIKAALADRFTHSGYFDDFAKLANAADPKVKGTYVTLNVVDPALLARRGEPREDVVDQERPPHRRWLPVDLDPVAADSGNGAHLLYAIDLANDDPSTALVKRVLATLFSDDVVTVW